MIVPQTRASLIAGICSLAFLHLINPTGGDNKTVQLIDEVPLNDSALTSLAETLCDDMSSGRASKRQISRISTIYKLSDRLESLNETNETILKCRRNLIKPLRELRHLLSTSNSNVCSDEKVMLIERFHYDYVSEHTADLSQRKPDETSLPTMLKLFFMHYALEVSAVCKRNMINNLEWDVESRLTPGEFEPFETDSIGKLLNSFSNRLVMASDLRNFDDAILVWDLIDAFKFDVSDWGPDGPPAELLEDDPDGIKAHLKVNKVKIARQVQEVCSKRFKPFYDKTIVPIIRLSNIGYSCKGEQFSREIKELKQNLMVKRWYGLTQMCEAMLPINFVEDPTLNDGAGFLITANQAEELEPIQPARDPELDKIEQIQYEPSTNSLERLDQLEEIANQERQEQVNAIKLWKSSRSRILMRCIKRILYDLRSVFSLFKMVQLFVTEKKQEMLNSNYEGIEIIEETGNLLGSNSVMKNLSDLPESELFKLEGGIANRNRIRRAKRRPRKNDIDTSTRIKTQAISYMHTKSLSEIFRGWYQTVYDMLPSRRMMIVVGILIIGIAFICIIGATFGHHLLAVG